MPIPLAKEGVRCGGVAALRVTDSSARSQRCEERKHPRCHFTVRGHLVEPSMVSLTVSFHVVGGPLQQGLYEAFHVIWIHLAVSCHHHTNKGRWKMFKQVLMAHIDAGTNALSSAIKDGEGTRTFRIGCLLSCSIGGAVVNHHRKVDPIGERFKHKRHG